MTAKKVFGTLHLWMGLIVGIPAAILGVTGILLMIVHPLPAQVGASIPPDVDRMLALARTAAPEGAVVQQFAAPADAGDPLTVRFSVPRSETNPRGIQQVQIDPKTGTVLPPPTSPLGWQRIVHDLHGNLMVDGRGGRQLVGWVGIVMAIMGITGLVIWWPKPQKWKEAFTVKTTGTRRRLLHDLHGAAGIWGLIVFIVVSVTGAVISFPFGIAGGGPGGPQPPRSERGAPVDLKVDAAVAVALQDRSGFGLIDVQMPRSGTETYRVRIAPVGADRAAPPLTVNVDSAAEKVTAVRDPADAPFPERLRSWSRQIHVGLALGWAWWLLVLVSGVLPVLFAISGTWLWLIKRRNKAAVTAPAVPS